MFYFVLLFRNYFFLLKVRDYLPEIEYGFVLCFYLLKLIFSHFVLSLKWIFSFFVFSIFATSIFATLILIPILRHVSQR